MWKAGLVNLVYSHGLFLFFTYFKDKFIEALFCISHNSLILSIQLNATFSKFTELYNHHYKWSLGHFYHPSMIPHAHILFIPTRPLPRATTHLQFVSIDLPFLDKWCDCNHTTCVLVSGFFHSACHPFFIADPGGLLSTCCRSQSPAVPRVCDPGYAHADGSHSSGQDSEEGLAHVQRQGPVFPSDSRSRISVPHLQPRQHNLFLSCSVSDAWARIT